MNRMKEMIEWLTGIEGEANRLYERAAVVFQDDHGLSVLLKQLAADEKLHHELMLKAGPVLEEAGDFTAIVSLDEETRRKVESPFAEVEGKLESGALSREELLHYLITLEFSELNHIFLYVMDSLKGASARQFSTAAMNVEQHKDRLRSFVEGRPGAAALMKRMGQLPRVLKRNILVVDDADMNLSLLKAVLEGEGAIEAASNGDEALKKVVLRPFSAIVADVDMPVMDGIEFYKRAVERCPGLKERFIFITGSADADRVHFFRDNHLQYLTKPAPISEIRRKVRELVHS